jgi:hypothetical protein
MYKDLDLKKIRFRKLAEKLGIFRYPYQDSGISRNMKLLGMYKSPAESLGRLAGWCIRALDSFSWKGTWHHADSSKSSPLYCT